MNRCHTADRAEFRRRLLSGNVFQDFLNNVRTGDVSDDAQPTAAVRADRQIDREYSLSLADPPSRDQPIARVPILPTLSAGFAAQSIGVAQMALDTILHLARTKITPDPIPDLRDRAAAQSGFAELSCALNAARAHLHRCVGNVWDKAVAASPIALEDIGDIYGAALVADRLSVRTVDTMYAIGGTTSIYAGNALERAQRDIHVMARHVIAQPNWLEDVGRVRFGLAPTNQLFAV